MSDRPDIMSDRPDVRLRPDAGDPITTRVELTSATKLEERCHHGKVLWRIDGQLWHVVSVTREHPHLVPCDTRIPPPKAKP